MEPLNCHHLELCPDCMEKYNALRARVAVLEDERKIMQDPEKWPDWKKAFAEDVYGVPTGTISAAIRGRK